MAKWTKTKDITVTTGSYKDKDGKDKNRYENVGQVLKSDDGKEMFMLKKTFNPAGVTDKKDGEFIILSLFDVKDNNNKTTNKTQSDDLDSDCPF